jgi:hypothetical protein
MPSANFEKIRVMLNARNAIYAMYKSDSAKRELCPHVLGYKSEDTPEIEPNERVLCYQLDGPDQAQGWRCFDVSVLEIIEPAPPAEDWVTPSDYNSKSKWQNSVQKIKHQV